MMEIRLYYRNLGIMTEIRQSVETNLYRISGYTTGYTVMSGILLVKSKGSTKENPLMLRHIRQSEKKLFRISGHIKYFGV